MQGFRWISSWHSFSVNWFVGLCSPEISIQSHKLSWYLQAKYQVMIDFIKQIRMTNRKQITIVVRKFSFFQQLEPTSQTRTRIGLSFEDISVPNFHIFTYGSSEQDSTHALIISNVRVLLEKAHLSVLIITSLQQVHRYARIVEPIISYQLLTQ